MGWTDVPVQKKPDVGIADSHGVGTEDKDAGRPCLFDQLVFQCFAVRPVSPKPDVIRPCFAPLGLQLGIRFMMPAAGTVTTARSTSPGISVTVL
jgi:hypothetical protein